MNKIHTFDEKKNVILFVESAETAESLCRSKMTKDYTDVVTILMGCRKNKNARCYANMAEEDSLCALF